MDSATKAKFVLALHKHSLRALDPVDKTEEKSVPVQKFSNGGTAAAGALSGAGSGALIGSVVPGIGTALGALGGGLIGGIAGLFSGDSYNMPDPYNPQDVQNNEQQEQNNYQSEQGLEGELQQQAVGGGPNPAQAMLNQTTTQNNNYAQGIAASQRGLNPALAARMAMQAQSKNNQTAAGQAATMNAQQQLAAEGTLGSLEGQIGNQSIAQQQTINNANYGANAINAGVAAQNSQTAGELIGGAMQGAGSFAGMKATGKAYGGRITDPMKHVSRIYHPHMNTENKDQIQANMPALSPASLMKKGGEVAAQSPSEQAKVKGDSPKNDRIPALLSENEIVIPRHITMAKNAPEKAAAFVRATLNKRKMKAHA